MNELDRTAIGATVRCTDGVLGTLQEINETDGVRVLQVRAEDGLLAVPVGLVRRVRSDGGIDLACGVEAASSFSARAGSYRPATETVRLHEEELVPTKEMRQEGSVELRTFIEEYPGRVEVEALREEVEIEHLPAGEEVAERKGPYEDGDYLYVPVYEEQLVVSKRLILKERIRIKRRARTEVRVFEDTLKRERLEVTQPKDTILVRETFDATNGNGAPRRQ